MYVAIVSAGTAPLYYEMIDKKLNQLIETSQCFVFTLLSGYVKGHKTNESTISEKWAREYGLPVFYISANTVDDLIDKLIYKADYAIFVLDGNPLINNAFMRYKMSGKHGTVIKVPL